MAGGPEAGAWVPWRVYVQDRDEDRRAREQARHEDREDTAKIVAKLEALSAEVSTVRSQVAADDTAQGTRRSIGSLMLTIGMFMFAAATCALAIIGRVT